MLARAVAARRDAPAGRRRPAVPLATSCPTATRCVNAGRFVKEAGADAVKLEGAGPTLERIRAVTGAGMPVMGHLGLTPQTATALGGFKAQGRTTSAARSSCCATRAPSRRPAPSRWCWSASRRRSPRAITEPPRSPSSASARAPAATARCWSTTTCSGLGTGRPPRFVKQYAQPARRGGRRGHGLRRRGARAAPSRPPSTLRHRRGGARRVRGRARPGEPGHRVGRAL